MQQNKNYLNFWDVVFSLKTFLSAILGLFIALYYDLDNPYWVLTTIYIVSNPLSGPTVSKAIYRLLGTIFGGIAAVLMLPQLITSPELTTVCFALWLGLCLFLCIIDRTPRSYAYMLAGYTAIIIAFPIVNAPQNVFIYAVSRVQEISVGIISVALINQILFPRNAKPILENHIDSWLKDSADFLLKCIKGEGNTDEALKSRQKIAVDALNLKNFTIQSSYDKNILPSSIKSTTLLQNNMETFVPMLENINNLVTLRNKLNTAANGGKTNNVNLDKLIDLVIKYIEADLQNQKNIINDMRTIKNTVLEELNFSKNWVDLVSFNLTIQLCELIETYTECFNIRYNIIEDKADNNLTDKIDVLTQPRYSLSHYAQTFHADHFTALLSAFAAFLAICFSVTMWRFTAWPQGGSAATMTGVFCCMLANINNPSLLYRKLFVLLFITLGIAFVVQFAIFPAIDGFLPLVLTLGLFLIPAGTMMATQSTYILGLALAVVSFNYLRINKTSNLDFSSFINNNFSLIFGIVVAVIATSIIRSVGAEWSIKRLIRSCWMDIVSTAKQDNTTKGQQYLLHDLVERFGLLNIKVSTISPDSKIKKNDILLDACVALNTIALQHIKNKLDSASRDAIDHFLNEISSYYKTKLKRNKKSDGTLLLKSLDLALNRIINIKNNALRQEISFILTELRETLFSSASSFQIQKTI